MFIASLVVAAVLAVLLVVSAAGKLRQDPNQMEVLERVGARRYRILLASLEFAGAVGMLAGHAWLPLGIAAQAGVIAYFVGAVVAHLRAGDRRVAAPAVIGALALVGLILRVIVS